MSRSLDSGRGRSRAVRIAGVVVLLGVVGFMVAASGVVPIRASAGHWPVTRWFLEFSMRRSVETHTLGSRVPDLDDPALVHRGAGHYGLGCEPCHGAPGQPPSRVTSGMTPRPPWLPGEVARWAPDDLHYIVRHGIKFTGMPAWPAPERDDEVWAVVAFIRLLPTMDADAYRRLTLGETADGRPVDGPTAGSAAVDRGDTPAVRTEPGAAPTGDPPSAVTRRCARCHGADGGGRSVGAFPRLAGQSRAYLEASLRAYARGDRPSGIMEPLAAELSDEEVRRVSGWYAARAPRPGPLIAGDTSDLRRAPARGTGRAGGGQSPADAGDPIRGESIARRGVPDRRIPSCVPCHGPASEPRHPAFPSLSGQHEDYLALQLRLFREGSRGGSAFAHVMGEVSHHLGPRDIADVAAWYASLPSASGPGTSRRDR